MNPEALGFGRVGAVWEGCDVYIREVYLTSASDAAPCIAMFQPTDPKPVNFTNNDSRYRHCRRAAPAKFYSEASAQHQHERKRRVNYQTEMLAHERTVARILTAIQS
ncbi:MAG: hypothetical protein ACJ8G2_18840 [Burkholderiales bacterium]|jgi:hypothetical protein